MLTINNNRLIIYRQTDRQTDRQTAVARIIACFCLFLLCDKVSIKEVKFYRIRAPCILSLIKVDTKNDKIKNERMRFL